MEKLYWTIMIPAPSEKVIFKMEVFNLETEADARLEELKKLKVSAYKVLTRGELK